MPVCRLKIADYIGAALIAILLISCQKEPTVVTGSSQSSSQTSSQTVSGNGGTTATQNRPPVARAGADQVITLYAGNLLLDGRASSDPDNNIREYAWAKVAGPAAGIIENAAKVQTPVKDFTEGIYFFELKITDAGGLTAKDTVQITVRLPEREADRDIYIAGSESNGTKSIAKYWKNGIPVTLSDGSYSAIATGIAVAGNDVHVIGWATGGTFGGNHVAMYWKNGIPVFLSNGHSVTRDIAVSGNDVYVSGYEVSGNEVIRRYWKNGTPISVPGNPPGDAIAIAGNEFYVAGSEADGDPYYYIGWDGDTIYTKYRVIKYWKNGIPVRLSDGKTNADVTDMVVVGEDVYVVGHEEVGDDRVARYWKNGVPVTLGRSSQGENGIAVNGSDVFVAGSGENGYGITAAKCWKNGIPSVLPSNYRVASATDIALFGNDVYITGYNYEYGGVETMVALYWKNGVAIPLTNGTYGAYAKSIAVVYR